MSVTESREELDRQYRNLHSKIWKVNNPEHTKKMKRLRCERNNILKAIPNLKEKLERYEKRLPQLEKEMRQTSVYRILGQKRKRKTNNVEEPSS